MARRRLRDMVGTIAAWGLVVAMHAVHAQELCQTLKSCQLMTQKMCDRTTQTCPPCMFKQPNVYICTDKSPDTNTCPYANVVFDCTGFSYGSTNTSSSTNIPTNATNAPSNATSKATATPAPTATAKSPIGMYAAIGGGALLVLIVIIVIVMRRRRRGRNMPKFADSPRVFDTKRGAKAATANTPYTNMPNTSKGAYHQRKFSDPVLESSGVMMGAHQNESEYSGNTATDSLDGMLAMDNTPPPAVLGDPLQRTRSKRGFSSGFKRLNSGGKRSSTVSSTYDTPVSNKNGANLVDEYLKMKNEFQFDADAMSDYGSDMMSLDRFSVNSSLTASGVGGGGHHHNVLAMSIADSEYQQSDYQQSDLMRSRTESECFSEMSYNDEKYSFSEDADLTASIVRQPPSPKSKHKEVEI